MPPLHDPHLTRLESATFDWASGSGGASAVRRILGEATAADGRAALNEAAVLTLRHHGLATGILLVASAGGPGAEPAGFVSVQNLSGSGRPELDLVVAPAARGAGLGTALALEALRILDGIPVTAWSHGHHPAAARIAERVGFEAVRELWLMRRPVAGPLPPAHVPDGFTVREFDPERDLAGLLAVNAAAFAQHPEQGGLTEDGLRERMGEAWFDPAGLLVADDGSTVVGFHWTKVHDRRVGEVYVIGVGPAGQGRGLGRALLVAGLDHLAARGLEGVLLYVEGDNHGAVRLYESFGFTHTPSETDVMYAER